MDGEMSSQVQNERNGAEIVREPYRQHGGRGKKIRVWVRYWVVIGESLDGKWLYIQPKRLHREKKIPLIGKALYNHAMVIRNEWEREGLDQIVIYIPDQSEQVRVWNDGNVTSVLSLSTNLISMMENAQTA